MFRLVSSLSCGRVKADATNLIDRISLRSQLLDLHATARDRKSLSWEIDSTFGVF